MKIQRLNVNDAPTLTSLLKWSRPADSVTLQHCEELLGDSRNLFIAATNDDSPIGIIVAYVIPRFNKNAMFLYEIDVHPDFRERGVATEMIEFLKVLSRSQGMAEIFVLTNAANVAAMNLYKRTGGLRANLDDVMFSYDLEEYGNRAP